MAEAVLVVDDHSFSRLLVRFLLERAGYAVLETGTGEEAPRNRSARGFRPDTHGDPTPWLEGLEAVRRLRAKGKTRHVGIVATSTGAEEGDERLLLTASCDGYLSMRFPGESGQRFQHEGDH